MAPTGSPGVRQTMFCLDLFAGRLGAHRGRRCDGLADQPSVENVPTLNVRFPEASTAVSSNS